MQQQHKVRAIVLISAPAKRSGEIVEVLRNISQVRQAAAVFGDVDVFAVLETDNTEELETVVMQKIQGMEEVTATRTHILISHMSWSR